MTTNPRLETWWASLDDEARQHAHECVDKGAPDEAFLRGLVDARIGLTRSGWARVGSENGHIPRAIEQFVESHPVTQR